VVVASRCSSSCSNSNGSGGGGGSSSSSSSSSSIKVVVYRSTWGLNPGSSDRPSRSVRTVSQPTEPPRQASGSGSSSTVRLLSLCMSQLSTCRAEMSALQKFCDSLLDQAAGTLTPDDLLQTARTERDALNDRYTAPLPMMLAHTYVPVTLCGLRGRKNRPTPFPGLMRRLYHALYIFVLV